MRIKFQINRKYDEEMISVMIVGNDWEIRAKKMELDMNLANRIHESNC